MCQFKEPFHQQKLVLAIHLFKILIYIQNLIFLASNGLTGETTSPTISSGLISISRRFLPHQHFPKHFQAAKGSISTEKFNKLNFQRTELHDLHGVQGCNLPECKSPTFQTLATKNPTFLSLHITTFFNSFSLSTLSTIF